MDVCEACVSEHWMCAVYRISGRGGRGGEEGGEGIRGREDRGALDTMRLREWNRSQLVGVESKVVDALQHAYIPC